MKPATVLLGCPGWQRVDDGFADDSLIRLAKTVPTRDNWALESGPEAVTVGFPLSASEWYDKSTAK